MTKLADLNANAIVDPRKGFTMPTRKKSAKKKSVKKAKAKRGRPPGSKNKKRGRPKGSKNKNHTATQASYNKFMSSGLGKRGRPKKTVGFGDILGNINYLTKQLEQELIRVVANVGKI